MSTDSSVRKQTLGPLELGKNLFPRAVPEISLYIHIPFCTSRCRYCNFYFETGWSPRVLERTLDTIIDESQAFLPWLFPQGKPKIRTVYFGGGTPSIIPPVLLDRFLGNFRRVWGLDSNHQAIEIAFEANPETISWDLLATLGNHSVNRLSLGVQSFSSDALQLLGRRAAEADVERALHCINKARLQGVWSGKLNVDLICGIPGQTENTIAEDIRRLLLHKPDHVSLYNLTVEPETPLQQLFDQGLRKPLEAEETEAIWDRADQLLEQAGFRNYEISNYALPGCESLHNLGYWELAPYLGLGPGAVGTIPVLISPGTGFGPFPGNHQSHNQPAIARLTNPSALAYSRIGRQGWEHAVEELSPRDFLIDHFLTGLRVSGGLDLNRLERIFQLPVDRLRQLLARLQQNWESKGWIDTSLPLHRLGLSRAGRFVLNTVLSELMDAVDAEPALFQESFTPVWPTSA